MQRGQWYCSVVPQKVDLEQYWCKMGTQWCASEGGLGAVLMQDGHPVAFTIRSLSLAERSDAQMENEFLAVVFGAKRSHQYVYGRPISVETTWNNSQETIAGRAYKKRLQRMMLALQGYGINLHYIPGRDVPLRMHSREPYPAMSQITGRQEL